MIERVGLVAAAVCPVALYGLLVLAACGDGNARNLPVYWDSPEFALVDQAGDTLHSGDLEGTVWVASFVFTNCAGVCRDLRRGLTWRTIMAKMSTL